MPKPKEQLKLSEELLKAMKDLRDIKNKKEEYSKKVKELNEDEEYLEGILISKLRSEGHDKVSVIGVGTASISVDIIPTIENWDKVINFAIERKEFGIIKKSISTKAVKELQGHGITVPGIKNLEKDKLYFRRSK